MGSVVSSSAGPGATLGLQSTCYVRAKGAFPEIPGVLLFMPCATNRRQRHCIFGSFVRSLTFIYCDVIPLYLVEGFQVKLATNTHHASGNWSEFKGQGHMHTNV